VRSGITFGLLLKFLSESQNKMVEDLGFLKFWKSLKKRRIGFRVPEMFNQIE